VNSLPSPLPRILLPSFEHPIILRGDDIAETDVDDLGGRIPPAELLAHLLAQELRERVGRFRPFDLFGDGQLGRRVRVERNAKDSLGGRDRDVLDSEGAGRFEDVVRLEDVRVEDDVVGLG